MKFFDNFSLETLQIGKVSIRFRYGGAGPPLLLLHGNPQTHAMWHAVAPDLAKRYTVICPDLRGYGGSFKPDATPDHNAYSKREMAKDLIQLMEYLGFSSFRVAGHDRGARVSHRMALDYPEQVKQLAVLDIIPTIEHFERANMDFAMGYYHWFWFAQPHPFPENIINSNPVDWFHSHTSREPKEKGFFHPDALADYLNYVSDPEMIRGMCEDYRAASTIDLEHDRNSRTAGVKIDCPLLALWGAKGKIGQWYSPLEIWRTYCSSEISGKPINSGHYLAEEAPKEVLKSFDSFFA